MQGKRGKASAPRAKREEAPGQASARRVETSTVGADGLRPIEGKRICVN
jgi:hypothetical protein